MDDPFEITAPLPGEDDTTAHMALPAPPLPPPQHSPIGPAIAAGIGVATVLTAAGALIVARSAAHTSAPATAVLPSSTTLPVTMPTTLPTSPFIAGPPVTRPTTSEPPPHTTRRATSVTVGPTDTTDTTGPSTTRHHTTHPDPTRTTGTPTSSTPHGAHTGPGTAP